MSNEQINIAKNKSTRIGLILIGWIMVGLGIVGIFLPIMPTTVFLIIAAACFARSSEKFYVWLINNKYLGKFIRDYREKRGMPLKSKFFAIIMIVLVISYSVIFAVDSTIVRVLLISIMIGVSGYIISLKTIR